MIKFDDDGNYGIEFEDYNEVQLRYDKIKGSMLYVEKPYIRAAVDLFESKSYYSLGFYLLYLPKDQLEQLDLDLKKETDDTIQSDDALGAIVLLLMTLLNAEGHTVETTDVDGEKIMQALDSLRICTTITVSYRKEKIKGKVLFKNFSLIDHLDRKLVDNP